MTWFVVGTLVVVAFFIAVIARLTRSGRMADRACCPADPSDDLRMRGADGRDSG